MKRAWRIIFKNGSSCTMIEPEIVDHDTALQSAVDRFGGIVAEVV